MYFKISEDVSSFQISIYRMAFDRLTISLLVPFDFQAPHLQKHNCVLASSEF